MQEWMDFGTGLSIGQLTLYAHINILFGECVLLRTVIILSTFCSTWENIRELIYRELAHAIYVHSGRHILM